MTFNTKHQYVQCDKRLISVAIDRSSDSVIAASLTVIACGRLADVPCVGNASLLVCVTTDIEYLRTRREDLRVFTVTTESRRKGKSLAKRSFIERDAETRNYRIPIPSVNLTKTTDDIKKSIDLNFRFVCRRAYLVNSAGNGGPGGN